MYYLISNSLFSLGLLAIGKVGQDSQSKIRASCQWQYDLDFRTLLCIFTV